MGRAQAPCPQPVIPWVPRLSITRLHQASALPHNPLRAAPCAHGGIWIIAISSALGCGTLLAVLALDAPHDARQAGAPGLAPAPPIAVSVAESWPGEAGAEVRKALIGPLGRPVAVRKDGGSAVAQAADALDATGLGTRGLDARAPVAAHVRQHPYVPHPQFAPVLAAWGQVAPPLKHSALACLAPPKTSPKARFMPVHRLVQWAAPRLQHAPPGAARAGSAVAKLRGALDRFPACQAFIHLFRRDAEALWQGQEVLNVQGLREPTRAQCHQLVEAMPPASPVRQGWEAWRATQRAVARALGVDTVGWPISSDPLASLVGVAKPRSPGPIKDAARLAVYLPAFCGQLSPGDAASVLAVSVAPPREVLGSVSSLSQQRRPVLPNPGSLASLFAADCHRHVERLAGAKHRSKSAGIYPLSDHYEPAQGALWEAGNEATVPLNRNVSVIPMAR